MKPQSVPIGRSNNRNIYFSPERRSTHMHVIGGTGMGKSKFLEHMIREDILKGHGLCFIDPHGETFDAIVDWCALKGVEKFRRIHIIDPSKREWRPAFNPLHRNANEDSLGRVDHMIEALAQVWGGEESRETPAIRSVLRVIFAALAEKGLTLAESFSLTRLNDEDSMRAFLSDGVTSPIVREMWEGYCDMARRAPREFLNEFGGPRRRLLELLHDDYLREMFGQEENSIDFRKCMDEGDIVLVNLSEKSIDESRARALGALLVREMFLVSKRRDVSTAERHPFYLYIDECGQFLTNDISKMLAQTRKFGLHAILSHQWLEQLKEKSPAIYAAVMGIQNKVVFGGLSDVDAELLANELFRSEFDIEMPIELLVKPSVIGYQKTWLHHWSDSSSDGDVEGESTAEVLGGTNSESQHYDEDGYPVGGVRKSDGISTSSGSGSSFSHVSTSSTSSGQSEAYVPEMENRISAVHSLDTVRHLAVKRLRGLPPQHAVVKGFNLPSFDMTTFKIDPINAHKDSVAAFTERAMNNSPYILPVEQAQRAIQNRTNCLNRAIREWIVPPEKDENIEDYLSR